MKSRRSYFRLMLLFLFCNVFSFLPGNGQELENLVEKYKADPAVYKLIRKEITLKEQSGQVVAESRVTKEKLLISSNALSMWNKEFVYHGSFQVLGEIEGEAEIPGKGGKIKKSSTVTIHSKLASLENVFYDDLKEEEVSFSGLTPKSLTRLRYSIRTTDYHMMQSLNFYDFLPVERFEYVIRVPLNIHVHFKLFGIDTAAIIRSSKSTRNYVEYYFVASDIKALKEWEDVPAISYYGPHLFLVVDSFSSPNSEKNIASGDLKHYYQYLYNFIRNVDTPRNNAYLKAVVAQIVGDDSTEEKKAAHIFEWVQKNIHYVAFEDSLNGFVPRYADKICSRKFGDCKDMACLLVTMNRIAGLKAHFCWVGTNILPYTFEELPLPATSNHMICCVETRMGKYFLDGTQPVIPFGAMPDRIMGKEALVAFGEDSFVIEKLPYSVAEESKIDDSLTISIDN